MLALSPLAAATSVPDQNVREFYPFTPSRRQQVFRDQREHLEVFYGGAAGGGKSDALLMTALEYISVPGYRAIIFRRTRPNLEDLIERSHEWFSGRAAFSDQRLRWKFPSGASLYFGHMQHEKDKFNYKGPAFQFIGWDELSEFLETQYRYMFSRLRRPLCQLHKAGHDPSCPSCVRSKELAKVPLRVRSGSNPDGEGIEWVKARFLTDDAVDEVCRGEYKDVYEKEVEGTKVVFVPSRVEDNPGLDQEQYLSGSLAKLDPVTRARLATGDWKISPDGLIKAEWFRTWTMQGDYYRLWRQDNTCLKVIHESKAVRFMIADCAASTEEMERRKQGKPASNSVISVFDWFREEGYLIWRYAWCGKPESPELLQRIQTEWDQWHPAWLGIEDEKTGRALAQLSRHLSVKLLPHEGKDKYTRAATWLNDLAQGKFFVPVDAPWFTKALGELLRWDGTKDSAFDHGDTCAYAAKHAPGRLMQGKPISIGKGFVTARV